MVEYAHFWAEPRWGGEVVRAMPEEKKIPGGVPLLMLKKIYSCKYDNWSLCAPLKISFFCHLYTFLDLLVHHQKLVTMGQQPSCNNYNHNKQIKQIQMQKTPYCQKIRKQLISQNWSVTRLIAKCLVKKCLAFQIYKNMGPLRCSIEHGCTFHSIRKYVIQIV